MANLLSVVAAIKDWKYKPNILIKSNLPVRYFASSILEVR